LKKWVVRPVGLKRQVVRPVRNSLQVRELLGIEFLKEPNCSYSSLRLLFDLLLKPWKGSGAAEGLLSREGAHFLGWDRHVGNERL
jgi:hypothetical protein